MNALEILRLISDTGLLVLIWMIQLIVYPAFRSIDTQRFFDWHNGYTRAITIVVAPLMFAQIGVASMQLLQADFTGKIWPKYEVFSFVLILGTWASTLWQASPLHAKLARTAHRAAHIEKLIQVNWYRTVLWTVIFLMTVLNATLKYTM